MTNYRDGDDIRKEGLRIINEMRDTRAQRERADANREGFFELHQRQKDTFATQADRLDKFESNATLTINSLTRVRVYIKLTDLNLGPFINEARQRARIAYLTGTRNWHLHYTHDVADIEIKLVGRSVFIQIMPNDKFFFEFATSGNPVVISSVVQDGVTYDSYKGCMVGVNVEIEKGKLITRPRILQNKRSEYGADLSLVHRPYQVQLINEPVTYPNAQFKYGRTRTKRTSFESYAPVHPWVGLTLRDTDGPFQTFGITTVCGPGSTFAMRDHSFDVPWQDGEKADPIRTAYIRGAADWPTTMAIQKVEDSTYGTREFGIYVDAYNQFAVFPLAAIGPINPADPTAQNVNEVYVKRVTPAFNSWVYKPTQKAMDYWAANPDVQEWSVDQPITDWKFNHLGTKCAALVFEREPYAFDTSFWSTDSNASCPFNSTKFDTLASWLGSDTNYTEGFAPQTYNPTRYFIAPGIVEVTVKIELYGADLNQFTVTLVVEEIRRPSTSYNERDPTTSRCALFVGYVWHNTPKRTNTNVMVEAGTLVALDIEYWIRPAGTLGESTERQLLLSVRDVKTNIEVFSAVGSQVLAIDLTTLSMVLRLDAYTTDRRAVDGGSTVLNFPVHHFGAWIIHSGVSKEVLFPDTIPEAVKLTLNSYAVMNGREFLAQRIAASGGGWEYVPLTTPKDGWTDSSVNSYRNYWAYQFWYWEDYWYAFIDTDLSFYGDRVKYKTSGSPPSYPSDGDDTEKWLNSIGGDFRTLFFCDSPRWGWNAYAAFVPNFVAVTAYATFFTHANGTYAFWSDAWLYDRNGLPGDYVSAMGAGAFSGVGLGSGTDYTHDTLAIYDATLIEHVIFDRVHFEIRVKDHPAFTNNTSFLELYNRAIERGTAAETLPASENIQPMTKANLRATFTKETGDDTGIEHYFLDLKMTWDGVDWWYRESAWSNSYAATPFPPFVGSSGNFNNINVYNYWRSTNYAGHGAAYSPGSERQGATSSWHRRFANPLIIMEK